jgi:hypothetical protein
MSPWVLDPHRGGTSVPSIVQEETRARILAAAEKRELPKKFRLEIRFKGAFCYVDAWEEGSPVPLHLCRFRYFGGRGEEAWSAAFYTYSHERYEPCVLASGKWFGTLEEGLDIGSVYLV